MPLFDNNVKVSPSTTSTNTITPTTTGVVPLTISPVDSSSAALNVLNSSSNPGLFVNGNGKVGIGTNTPGNNRLNVPWLSGDVDTTAFFGDQDSLLNDQTAVKGISGTSIGVNGIATSTGYGIYGSSYAGISGFFSSGYSSNANPTLVAAQTIFSTADMFQAQFYTGTAALKVTYEGKTGIGQTTPTAFLHLKAGTASANTAPLKLASGTNLTAAESGAIEFDGTRLYYTTSTPTRRTVATIRQTEIDFGSTPVADTSFTISDSDVNSSSIIKAWISYDAPTGKDLDEIEMDTIDLNCGQAGSGSFTLFAKPKDGYVADKFKVNYSIG